MANDVSMGWGIEEAPSGITEEDERWCEQGEVEEEEQAEEGWAGTDSAAEGRELGVGATGVEEGLMSCAASMRLWRAEKSSSVSMVLADGVKGAGFALSFSLGCLKASIVMGPAGMPKVCR